jgi:hypothetical protein
MRNAYKIEKLYGRGLLQRHRDINRKTILKQM